MANSNLHVMCCLDLSLEEGMPDHSILSRSRTHLTQVQAWNGLLTQLNQQIQGFNVTISSGCHVDARITHSPRKPKTKPSYEAVTDRDERDDETGQEHCDVLKVRGIKSDIQARVVKNKPLYQYPGNLGFCELLKFNIRHLYRLAFMLICKLYDSGGIMP